MKNINIERVQTGMRIENRILKVLRASADLIGVGLGELIEIMALHSFEGKDTFLPNTRKQIAELKKVYGLDYSVHDYEQFREKHH